MASRVSGSASASAVATASLTSDGGTVVEINNPYVANQTRTFGSKIKSVKVHNHGANPLWVTLDGTTPTVNSALPVVGPGDERIFRLGGSGDSASAVTVKLISTTTMTYSVEGS